LGVCALGGCAVNSDNRLAGTGTCQLSYCMCTSAGLSSHWKCIEMKEECSFTAHLLVWIYMYSKVGNLENSEGLHE